MAPGTHLIERTQPWDTAAATSLFLTHSFLSSVVHHSYTPKRNAISSVTQNTQGKEKWGHTPNGLPMADGDTDANSVNEASRGVRGL